MLAPRGYRSPPNGTLLPPADEQRPPATTALQDPAPESGKPAVRGLLSRVVIAFCIPFALGPLLWFTAGRKLMGPMANRAATSGCAVLICGALSVLNLFLVGRLLMD